MIVKSRKKFFSDLGKIKSLDLIDHVEYIYLLAAGCRHAEDIPGFKWLTGYSSYGRIKIADYRIGVHIAGNAITFICFIHRSVIYEKFP